MITPHNVLTDQSEFERALDARIAARKAKPPKPKPIRESKVEDAHVASVKAEGGTSYKFTSPGRTAVPDRLDLRPITDPWHKELVARYVRFTEAKRPGAKPTPAQEREHARLRALGFRVDVVDYVKKDLFK